MIKINLISYFIDSIREIVKYKPALDPNKPHGHVHGTHSDAVIREFRAQRNFYITGFALFLWL